MSLTSIRCHEFFRFLAFVLICQFQTVQIPQGYTEVQYQEDLGSYQAEKPAGESEGESDSSGSGSDLPNPSAALEGNPLSAASEEPQGGSGSGTVSFSGSIQIDQGNPFANQREVNLYLDASGGMIQGDGNGDGSVDAADYVVWRKMGGSQADYDAWRGNFGKTNGITEMCFSNDGTNFTCQAYQSTATWMLSEGDGEKTVYVKFRDYFGNESEALDFFDTILLDTVPPALQNQNLKTNEGVRKTMILGDLYDQEGDLLTYSYTASAFLEANGDFILIDNQLHYIPDYGFLGTGEITIQATDGFETSQAVINLEVKVPVLNVPNDPLFSEQYGLDLTNAVRAWNLSRGLGVNVAIIDSGISGGIDIEDPQLGHPDLSSNIFTNLFDPIGDGIDNDGNGFIDDYHGWDFTTCDTFDTETDACTQTKPTDNDPWDENGHGTLVAGIVAAERNNGEGVSGIAPDSKLIPIQALNWQGSGFLDDAVNAINYAVSIGAKVINMSFGGVFSIPVSLITSGVVQALRNAIFNAYQAGVVVVAAAGNDNRDVEVVAPAALEHVITVGGTDQNDQRYTQSNYGDELDVAAPGVDILSTYPWWVPPYEDYFSGTGTSASAPFVSGLAAMLLSQDSTADYDDVFRRLKFSSVDLGAPLFDTNFGWGRIDAFQALSYDYYDNGAVKTQWLEEPNERGYTRLDFDQDGRLIGESLSPDLTLTPGTMPRLPGLPVPTGINTDDPTTPEIEFPSGPVTQSVGKRGAFLNYTTVPSVAFPEPPNFVGAGFSYDDPRTPSVIETFDFSGLTDLSLGIKGTPTRVRFEVVTQTPGEIGERRASVYLNGVSDVTEQVWTIPIDLLEGVDMTHVLYLYVIVEGENLAGTLEVNRWEAWWLSGTGAGAQVQGAQIQGVFENPLTPDGSLTQTTSFFTSPEIHAPWGWSAIGLLAAKNLEDTFESEQAGNLSFLKGKNHRTGGYSKRSYGFKSAKK